MNRLSRIVIVAALALAGAQTAIASAEKLPDRIQVTWAPAKQLTEVKDNRFGRGWLRPKDWMDALSKNLRKRADRILPPGEKLQVHVDDIKLAGAFEPWHTNPSLQDVRFYKDIYPPMMKVHYKLTAADGSTIREGDATLRDSSYLQRSVAINTNDPLRFDKRMIDDWLRREFGPKRGTG